MLCVNGPQSFIDMNDKLSCNGLQNHDSYVDTETNNMLILKAYCPFNGVLSLGFSQQI